MLELDHRRSSRLLKHLTTCRYVPQPTLPKEVDTCRLSLLLSIRIYMMCTYSAAVRMSLEDFPC